MPDTHNQIFEFGPFRLDAAERLLFEGAAPIALPPKALQTLLLLVQRHGRLVEKSELLKTVWPETYVEEASLAQNIFVLRKRLHERDDDIECVLTCRRDASSSRQSSAKIPPPVPSPSARETRRAKRRRF